MGSVLITSMKCHQRDSDLTVNARFKLSPLKVLTQHVSAELFFNKKLIKSFEMKIPYHFTRRELQIQPVLSLEKVRSGSHKIRLVLTRTKPPSSEKGEKSVTIRYDAKIEMVLDEDLPRVKSIGEFSPVEVVSDKAKELFRQIEERRRREIAMSRER
jgi:hypothetical protein